MSTPKRPTRPRDPNQLAHQVFLESIGERPKTYDPAAVPVEPQTPAEPERAKDPAAVALGRKGGLVGGKARFAGLSAEQRSEIARAAARARWDTKEQD